MNLYKISQDENDDYDTYDSAVVAAETEDQARNTMPSKYETWNSGRVYSSWCSAPDKVKVELIGQAKEGIQAGVILASFNAG